ncbi:Fc.00g033820.m01.CDS01 [Cosmosporella sp. VM-42]
MFYTFVRGLSKTTFPPRVPILGAGAVGTALATRLVHAGHPVTISNSTGPESLRREEQATGASAISVEKAATEADVVILAVPENSILSLRPIFQPSLRPGAILIDSSNDYPSRGGHIELLDGGMLDSDDDKAKSIVMEPGEDIGFDAFNAGQLADSWRQEPGQPAYCTETNLKQFPLLLSRADRKQAALNRDKIRAILEKLPQNFSP